MMKKVVIGLLGLLIIVAILFLFRDELFYKHETKILDNTHVEFRTNRINEKVERRHSETLKWISNIVFLEAELADLKSENEIID